MAFKDWFNKLSEDSQLWLVQNMETPLPPEISAEMVAAGGPAELSAADSEMIERVNNGDDVL